MSHFAVMVIGSDVEEQLAPYDENIEVPEYRRSDVTEEDKQEMLQYFNSKRADEEEYSSFEECYAAHGEDWNGNRWRKDENGVWADYSRYNPKSKWDWYSVGGRFSGAYITHVKEGVELQPENFGEWYGEGIDSIEKKYIDFDAIRKEAEDDAREKYRYIASLFKGGTIPHIKMKWKDIVEMFKDKPTDELDKIYKAQDGVIQWEKISKEHNKDENFPSYDTIDDYQYTEDEYAERARKGSFLPFAVVKNGEWYERGEMGWWAMVSNEKSEEEWYETVQRLLDETDDDDLITIMDCHI